MPIAKPKSKRVKYSIADVIERSSENSKSQLTDSRKLSNVRDSRALHLKTDFSSGNQSKSDKDISKKLVESQTFPIEKKNIDEVAKPSDKIEKVEDKRSKNIEIVDFPQEDSKMVPPLSKDSSSNAAHIPESRTPNQSPTKQNKQAAAPAPLPTKHESATKSCLKNFSAVQSQGKHKSVNFFLPTRQSEQPQEPAKEETKKRDFFITNPSSQTNQAAPSQINNVEAKKSAEKKDSTAPSIPATTHPSFFSQPVNPAPQTVAEPQPASTTFVNSKWKSSTNNSDDPFFGSVGTLPAQQANGATRPPESHTKPPQISLGNPPQPGTQQPSTFFTKASEVGQSTTPQAPSTFFSKPPEVAPNATGQAPSTFFSKATTISADNPFRAAAPSNNQQNSKSKFFHKPGENQPAENQQPPKEQPPQPAAQGSTFFRKGENQQGGGETQKSNFFGGAREENNQNNGGGFRFGEDPKKAATTVSSFFNRQEDARNNRQEDARNNRQEDARNNRQEDARDNRQENRGGGSFFNRGNDDSRPSGMFGGNRNERRDEGRDNRPAENTRTGFFGGAERNNGDNRQNGFDREGERSNRGDDNRNGSFFGRGNNREEGNGRDNRGGSSFFNRDRDDNRDRGRDEGRGGRDEGRGGRDEGRGGFGGGIFGTNRRNW